MRNKGFWKLVRGIKIKNLWETVQKVSKRSGKPKIFLLADILFCGAFYGAGYQDYWLYEFENLTRAQRKTYVTRNFNNRIVRLMNPQEVREKFSNKGAFNRKYQDLLGRDFLDLLICDEETFSNFCKKHRIFAAKLPQGSCGKGFERVEVSEETDLSALMARLKAEGKTIVEEYLFQHKALADIYPNSINTVRIATLNQNDEIKTIYAFLRIGNSGHLVDNVNSGGMCAPVDLETGTVTACACDKEGKVYQCHPVTGAKILGAKIPYWKECLNLCIKAADRTPDLGYIGWDVCVTENGPVLVEGNEFPGHDLLQLPAHRPDGTGIKPMFLSLIPQLK